MSILPYTRTILRLTGKDVRSFLQGITTQDINALNHHPLLFTAFLSPQGKLLFDGFFSLNGDSLLLDLATPHAEQATTYLKRYKLRADVQIEPTNLSLTLGTGHPDPRHPDMPARHYLPLKDTSQEGDRPTMERSEMRGDELREAQEGAAARPPSVSASEPTSTHYHALRLAHALPESAYDSTGDDVAMDLGYDLLHAISFTKGCYVGQEVTARMHYKHIARRGVFHATTADGSPLPPYGTPLTAGETKLGELRSVQGPEGIALAKFEPWETALSRGTLITANSTPIILSVPSWAQPKFALYKNTSAP